MKTLEQEILAARKDFIASLSEKQIRILKFMGYRLDIPEEIATEDVRRICNSWMMCDKLKELKKTVAKRLVA